MPSPGGGFFQAALNSIPANVAVLSAEGNIVAVNDSWKQFADENDSPKKYYIGANYFEVCRAASATGDTSARQALDGLLGIVNGRVEKFEFEYPCDSRDKKRWFLMRASRALLDPNHLIVVHIDLTAQRAAEEALAHSEERFRTVVETAPDAIFITDADGRFIEVNQSACMQLKYSREQLLTLSVSDIVPGELVELSRARIQAATGSGIVYESRYLRSDGAELAVELSARRIVLNGHPAILTVARDITERRMAQETLRISESKHRRLLRSMMDGFVLVGMEGTIREVNPAYAAMLGYSDQELYKLTYDQLTPPKWHSFEHDIVQTQVLTRGFSDVYEKEYIRKDGTIFPVELRTFLLRGEQDEFEGMWAIVRDCSRRKEAEKKLSQTYEQLKVLNAQLSAERAQLADKNTALREVLTHIEEEKGETRASIAENMRTVIFPLVRSLRKSAAHSAIQMNMLKMLERALTDVTSPFVSRLQNKFDGLTPRELQVCNMVKDGQPSKEIAEYLGISILTVSKLRQQIRHKLGIENKNVGLSEYLQTL